MFFEFVTKKAVRTATKALFCVGLMSPALLCFAETETSPAPTMPQMTPAKKQPTKEELMSPDSMNKLALMYGHFIYKSMNNPILKMDASVVIQGIKDGEAGKTAPMTDKEYEETLTLLQRYAMEDAAQNNLKDAEAFLEKNKSEKGIVLLDGGKVQYVILQPGTGEVVTDKVVPTLHYTATYSTGQKLGSSVDQGGPIAIPLDAVLPGFRDGVMGMHVGEKRRIFVHPEVGYGPSGPLPNGLLIFEVEVVSIAPKEVAQNDDDMDDEDMESLDDEDYLSDDDDDENDDDDEVDNDEDDDEDLK